MGTADRRRGLDALAMGAMLRAIHETMVAEIKAVHQQVSRQETPSPPPPLHRLLDQVDLRLDGIHKRLRAEQAADLCRIRRVYRQILGLPYLKGVDRPPDDSS